MAIDHAERAGALVGIRFRPQGRDEQGLDCVGVVLATYDLPSASARRDYRLSGDHAIELHEQLRRYFRPVPKTQLREGDVMLLAAGERQMHLAVKTRAGFVHAHAGIRRVVETPGDPQWPLVGVYRRRRSS